MFKLHNETEFNVTLEMLQDKYEVARANTLKGLGFVLCNRDCYSCDRAVI